MMRSLTILCIPAIVLTVNQAAARDVLTTARPRDCVGQLLGPNSSVGNFGLTIGVEIAAIIPDDDRSGPGGCFFAVNTPAGRSIYAHCIVGQRCVVAGRVQSIRGAIDNNPGDAQQPPPIGLASLTRQNQYPNSIAVECSVVRISPPDRSRNPDYKVNVSVIYDDAGILQSMSIIHTLMNGQEVDRSDQYYYNFQLDQRDNLTTWSGYRGPLKMTGVFNRNTVTCVEYITRNGRLETKVDTRCH
jgi:hypothetical protein